MSSRATVLRESLIFHHSSLVETCELQQGIATHTKSFFAPRPIPLRAPFPTLHPRRATLKGKHRSRKGWKRLVAERQHLSGAREATFKDVRDNKTWPLKCITDSVVFRHTLYGLVLAIKGFSTNMGGCPLKLGLLLEG